MTFSQKLQNLRKQHAFSQEQLAEKLSVSRQAVSKWEVGEAVPETENIILLSKIFSVSTDYLLLDELEEPLALLPVQVTAAKKEEKIKKPALITGVIFTVVGSVCILVLWVLSTMIESFVPASVADEFGTIWYTTQVGYSFWPFIERFKLQAIFFLGCLVLLVGVILLFYYKYHNRKNKNWSIWD